MDYRHIVGGNDHYYLKNQIVLKRNKNIVILGAGESGLGAALLAQKQGYRVFVSDRAEISDENKNILEQLKIDFEERKHTIEKILQADILVKSPGIPESVPVIQKILRQGIPVISEIEFAFRHTSATICAITGSNGKTTTTMMLYQILHKAGLDVAEAGNIGDSFAGYVARKNIENYVLELSSFQLDGIVSFKPHIAIITNITPDHLDRYNNHFESYVDSKFRISMNQTASDYLIYDADDKTIETWLNNHKIQAQLLPFSIKKHLKKGAYLENNNIVININNKAFTMSLATLAVQGNHNIKNSMAASLAATLLKVRKETIRESLEDFEGAPHRLEKVLKIRGIQFINDSKATNINATYYALESMQKPTVWIVGGEDKGNDYMELMPLVRGKVKAIVCLGLDNEKIVKTFENVMPVIVETKGAEEAVKVAFKLAEKGDNVLLSPACASYDLFKNYQDRGNQFKQAILKL